MSTIIISHPGPGEIQQTAHRPGVPRWSQPGRRTPGGSIPGQAALAAWCAPGRSRTADAWFVPFVPICPCREPGRPVPPARC